MSRVAGRGTRRLRAARAAGVALACMTIGLALAGCDTARVLAPPAPLRAASAADYAVNVAFAEPLVQASAEDPARYVVYFDGAAGTPASISTATLIDTVSLRVVQLVIPGWLGDSTADHRAAVVETHGVRDYFGHDTGDRRAAFVTGLGYASHLQAFFDARCSGCHGAAGPGGNYRTDSYAALFGPGTTPTANVIAGDPNCLTVVKCRPRNSMYDRAKLEFFDFEMILDWVTSYLARP